MKEPVVVIVNHTNPEIDLHINTTTPSTTSTSSQPRVQVSFSITMRRLVEQTHDGKEVPPIVGLRNSDVNFTFLQSSFPNSSNSIYEYSSVLCNGAIINITVSSITNILINIISYIKDEYYCILL